MLSDDDADRVFQALADRTRRDVVLRVLTAEQSVTALAERYAMSFAAVQRHVAVLERAGLVRKQRRGREQLVSADVAVIHQATALLDAYENLWQQRVARIDALLETEGDADAGPGVREGQRRPDAHDRDGGRSRP